MRNVRTMAIVLGSVLTIGASAASAAEASADTCMSMASKVKTALDGAQSSPNHDQANKERGYGRDFCSHGMYKIGVDHYAQALKLLGVEAS